MEKAENKNIQKVQNGKGEASPNTKRRLKLHLRGPKLHINIPFFKHGHRHNDSSPEDVLREVSTSLPIESHMPGNIRDPTLYQDCECEPENGAEDDSAGETVLLEKVDEDEPESEKHQSDLEENEKDSSSDTEVKKQVKFLVDESQQTAVSPDDDDDEVGDTPEDKGSITAPVSMTSKGKGCCSLKSCLKDSCEGRPRASTYPGPVDCLEARFERHVSFSPDTMEPRTRNCKYREWMEMKCPHTKVPSINIKHEKRKCQLQQMRKVNISDYMSRNYGASFYSPMGSFGGDLMM